MPGKNQDGGPEGRGAHGGRVGTAHRHAPRWAVPTLPTCAPCLFRHRALYSFFAACFSNRAASLASFSVISHRWIRYSWPSAPVSFWVLVGFHSPISKRCDTTREPGLSVLRRIGLSR